MIHPNDKLAALDWALRKALAEDADDNVRLMILPVLRELHGDAVREARG